jgi:ABC-type transport system involved in cytochrome c biogenesis permease subunit
MAAAVLVGVGIVILTGVVFTPLLFGRNVAPPERQVVVPAYDYKPWASLVVQFRGRPKPFESAAVEILREVYGRAKLQDPQTGEKFPAVPIVLQWMMLRGTSSDERFVDWEHYPFLLCDNHDLRKEIYAHQADKGLTEDQLHGKFIAPADLRSSPGFRKLIDDASQQREMYKDGDAMKVLTPLQRKAEEVASRLQLFDTVSQNTPVIDGKPRQQMPRDPLGVVALDKVPSGAWFSVGELRAIQQDPERWRKAMQERLAQTPQVYLSPERQEDLRRFQDEIKAGKGKKSLDELEAQLRARGERLLKEFDAAIQSRDSTRWKELYAEIAKKQEDRDRIAALIRKQGDKVDADALQQMLDRELRTIVERDNRELIEDLERRMQKAKAMGYHPEDPRFKMLHFDYLENRFPNLYRESLAWQEVPRNNIAQVVATYRLVQEAYATGDPEQFNEASQDYFTKLREVSEQVGDYPGVSTIGLEMSFNRVQPFMWAWVIMFLAVMMFAGSLLLQSRTCYLLGYAFFFGSLAFQLFGYYARVAISGRPPVSNMYETVIWVASMSALFALVLELVYRSKYIILAGAAVATLGLVLADQLPMALDPKISPLTPVLRSNYWLTVHVLTIVSSYAGGTLAWGLANITLAMMAFGKGRRETLHTLSQFTYRAMQIAVLLLAAGTFLGGWWAAESWGRFWGWDPKEVWALIALVCYVIPLHARYIGWVKDFGLAVSAVVCYAAIVMCWYGVNFVLGAGLHSYGFGGGGPWWVFWAGLINIEWVIIASMLYLHRQTASKLALAPVEATVLVNKLGTHVQPPDHITATPS